MLGRLIPTSQLGPRALLPLLGAALALASTSCSLVTGEHETETEFTVQPFTGVEFAHWNDITVPQDPNSFDHAELMYVRLEALDSNIRDLSFIQGITAGVEVNGVYTKVAEKAPIPPGERIVPLERLHDGDIRGFFFPNPAEDGYTIHIVWNGTVNPAAPIPSDGVRMKVKIAVRIE